ncbi:MAG TPA: histidine kinase [Longimicrobium sp.]|nr:histidine kinase [Longimicrobium sp.]
MTPDAHLAATLPHASRAALAWRFPVALAVGLQLLFTVKIQAGAAAYGETAPWHLAALLAFADLLTYAAVLGAALLLAWKLPVDRRRPLPALLAAAAAFVALVIAKTWAIRWVDLRLGGPPVEYWTWLLNWSGVYFQAVAVLMGAGYALLHVLREQERRLGVARLEAEVAQARFRALKGQLRPRFLFDTLAAVRGRVRTDRPAAERLLAQLGEMLRLTFRTVDADEVTLQQEVGFALLFLEIERTRGAAPIRVRASVDPSLRAAPVPHVSLFPLVEAAAAGAGGAQAEIAIEAERGPAGLEVRVRDTGALSLAGRRALPAWEGVERLRARLAALPGARLEMADLAGGGALATLALPLAGAPS